MAWNSQTHGQWFGARSHIRAQFVDMYLLACIGGILVFPMLADPLVTRIFSTSPENIQAKQEKALLVALGVDEEE